MAKKKKAKKPIQSLDTPEKAIKERARKLPLHECLISSNWHKLKMAEIVISRKHSNGNITYGVFLVDLYCTGLRDTFYNFNVSQKSYDEMLNRMNHNVKLAPCSYTLAHNIIYGGIEFADNYGFEPNKDIAVTEFILEEDDDNIPLIVIKFGYKGKPAILLIKDNNSEDDISTLRKNAGEGNYTILDIEQNVMHSDPENGMFEETNISLDDFLTHSNKNDFNESAFIEYVRGAFNKKLKETEELQQKNHLNYYVNDLIGSDVRKEEGLVRIENEEIRTKYFEFYELVNEQKTRRVKKVIPEIEEYYTANKEIPEIAALLLKCYRDIKDNTKFENLIEESIKIYPSDFSTRSVALDYYLAKDDYNAVLKLFNNTFTLQEYTKDGKPVNLSEARLFHLAYYYYFLEKQNIVQAEEYLRALSVYQTDDKAIKNFLLKLTLAKMFFIDDREKVESNLPKEVLDLL
jgi:hypothetical protein